MRVVSAGRFCCALAATARLSAGMARDLRTLALVELWKLRRNIGVVRASLADVLAQAEAARRAVDQLRWLIRDDAQAMTGQQQITGALDRVNSAVGHLCESATHLDEAARLTTANLGEEGVPEKDARIRHR